MYLQSAWINRNAKSTKTRIETIYFVRPRLRKPIAMRNPLKQGLKLNSWKSHSGSRHIAMRNPLKQGLKQLGREAAGSEEYIAMRNPLKQGLKLVASTSRPLRFIIAMRNPLKQGLKPDSFYSACCWNI